MYLNYNILYAHNSIQWYYYVLNKRLVNVHLNCWYLDLQKSKPNYVLVIISYKKGIFWYVY